MDLVYDLVASYGPF